MCAAPTKPWIKIVHARTQPHTLTYRQHSHRTHSHTCVQLKWEKFGVTFFPFSCIGNAENAFFISTLRSAAVACYFCHHRIPIVVTSAIDICTCVRRPSEHSIGISSCHFRPTMQLDFFRSIFIFISRDSDTHVSAIIQSMPFNASVLHFIRRLIWLHRKPAIPDSEWWLGAKEKTKNIVCQMPVDEIAIRQCHSK